MNVLVTNAKSRIAYNIVKSLAVKDINVYCADFSPGAMSFYSRYSRGHFLYPSPFRQQKLFIQCLIEKIGELKIDVLMPVFEELFLVARHKEELVRHVKMAIPDYSQILLAHNKDRWASLAQTLSIPLPMTCIIEEFAVNPDLCRELSYPVLLKPKQGGGGWGIRQVNSAAELTTILQRKKYQDLPLSRFFVQEKIEGDVICVAMVLSQGRLRGKTTYRQLREYPIFDGQATCRISITHREAENNLQKLLEHIEWHGVCQADFIIQAGTGRPFLVDINPRFWGSLVQGIASGVDFPYLSYQIALHGDTEPVDGFREGVKTRWLGGDLCGFLPHYANAKDKISFIRDYFCPKVRTERYDDFSFNDPFPFLAWAWDSLHRVLISRSNKPHDSLEGEWE